LGCRTCSTAVSPAFLAETGVYAYADDITVDPETRQEFEEAQKSGPLASVTGAANPMQGFDMAAWMARSGSKHGSTGVEEGGGARNRKKG